MASIVRIRNFPRRQAAFPFRGSFRQEGGTREAQGEVSKDRRMKLRRGDFSPFYQSLVRECETRITIYIYIYIYKLYTMNNYYMLICYKLYAINSALPVSFPSRFIFCTAALLSGPSARAITSRYKFRLASSGEREKNLLARSDRERRTGTRGELDFK